MQEVNC